MRKLFFLILVSGSIGMGSVTDVWAYCGVPSDLNYCAGEAWYSQRIPGKKCSTPHQYGDPKSCVSNVSTEPDGSCTFTEVTCLCFFDINKAETWQKIAFNGVWQCTSKTFGIAPSLEPET